MSERERDILTEQVRDVLLALEMLHEGKTTSFDPKIRGGEKSGMPAPVDSTYDYFVRRLRKWIRDAEDRVKRERTGQAKDGKLPALLGKQLEFYVLECEGMDWRQVAEKLSLPEETVRRIRRRYDRTVEYGKPKAA